MSVTHLRKQQRLVILPNGVQHIIVWARKVFPNSNIYEVSLERLDEGYTMWYAEIVDGKMNFICCSYCLSRDTMTLKIAEEGLKDEEDAYYYFRH